MSTPTREEHEALRKELDQVKLTTRALIQAAEPTGLTALAWRVAASYWAWIPPWGVFGSHHFARGDDRMGLLFASSFGLLGLGWLLDGALIPLYCRDPLRESRTRAAAHYLYTLAHAFLFAIYAESLWPMEEFSPVPAALGSTLALLISGQMWWPCSILFAVPWSQQVAVGATEAPTTTFHVTLVIWLLCVVSGQTEPVARWPSQDAWRLAARRWIPRVGILFFVVYATWTKWRGDRLPDVRHFWQYVWIRATEPELFTTSHGGPRSL